MRPPAPYRIIDSGMVLRLLFLPVAVALAGGPEAWIPARWTGGPLEAQRAGGAAQEASADWYDPATLDLLAGSPINCLLVTWSAGAADALERRQQELVARYAGEARRRGIAVLGVAYPGADPAKFVPAAARAQLDGLVLEGEFPPGFADSVTRAMAAAKWRGVAIAIAKEPGRPRAAPPAVVAVEGEPISARRLAEMGIRAAPSSEPWIQSNIWLVRSFRFSDAAPPVWISHLPERGAATQYARSVADAAVAGGRWIVTLDDELRRRLQRGDADARATWKAIGNTLRFAEEHAGWRRFRPFGNLGVIVDRTSPGELTDEYLKLLVRRQIPYRLVARTEIGTATAGLRALLATELASPTAKEREALAAFAERGGLVVAGPAFGEVPAGEQFLERTVGKGRQVVYRDPEPELIAREMRELLSLQDAGVMSFNVPSVITYAAADPGGNRLLVQLLNYSDSAARDITIRVAGSYRSARLVTPDAGEVELAVQVENGRTEVAIPRLDLWGGVVLEGGSI